MTLNIEQALAIDKLKNWLSSSHPWFLLEGVAGTGKALPNSEEVLTPDGWRLMGELKKGDKVIGSDGTPINIIGVYPQGKKDIYTIKFGDNSEVRCTLDHLWTVTTNKGVKKTLSLKDILKTYLTNNNKNPYQYKVEAFEGVKYGQNFPDAYEIGRLYHAEGCLLYEKSWMRWDYLSRLNLLRGILDENRRCYPDVKFTRERQSFTSVNKEVTYTVKNLIRNLGGRCSEPVNDGDFQERLDYRMPVYPYRDNKDWEEPLYTMGCKIINITKEAYQEDATCIRVDSHDRLFVTCNYKLTHNTYVVQQFLKLNPRLSTIVTAPTGEALNVIAEDLTGFPASTIHKLLGFRPTATETERQILIRQGESKEYSPPAKSLHYKLVIVEEAFYVPGIIMRNIITQYPHIKWLFLGDASQLPPVEESKSHLTEMKTHILHKHSLVQNMRTNCPIQKSLCEDVRDNYWGVDFSKYTTSKMKAISQMCQMIKDGQNPLFLAYHHRVVDQIGQIIREEVYDKLSSEPYGAGEVVRLKKVWDNEGMEIIRNNEKCTVLSNDRKTVVLKRTSGEVVYLDWDTDNLVEKAKTDALAAIESKEKWKCWSRYHKLNGMFPVLSSPISLTAHSSQGQTCDTVFLDLQDLKKCQTKELIYVAVSRSRSLPVCY